MKKILFIATIENNILNIQIPFINYFQNKGYEVHVATKSGDRKRELEQNGIICHHIDFSRSPYSLTTTIALKQLIKVMRAHKYSLVHVHTPVGAFLGRLAARLTHTTPVLYTAHGFHFYKGAPLKNWLIYYPMEKLAARWTDGIVTINEEDLQLAKRFSLRCNNSVYFAHGVGLPVEQYKVYDDDNLRKKLREQMGYTGKDTLILTVAELNKNKNQTQIIKALKEILKHRPNVHLLLVGNGTMELKLKKLTNRLNIEANVQFLGYRKDIPELLYISDIFVLTSLREGLPRCIMEAMAAGKPVVATNIRGNRDLVKNTSNGYLVPVNNVEKTINALLSLVNDRKLAFKMGENGQEMIKAYAIENVLKEMDIIYNKLLSLANHHLLNQQNSL